MLQVISVRYLSSGCLDELMMLSLLAHPSRWRMNKTMCHLTNYRTFYCLILFSWFFSIHNYCLEINFLEKVKTSMMVTELGTHENEVIMPWIRSESIWDFMLQKPFGCKLLSFSSVSRPAVDISSSFNQRRLLLNNPPPPTPKWWDDQFSPSSQHGPPAGTPRTTQRSGQQRAGSTACWATEQCWCWGPCPPPRRCGWHTPGQQCSRRTPSSSWLSAPPRRLLLLFCRKLRRKMDFKETEEVQNLNSVRRYA